LGAKPCTLYKGGLIFARNELLSCGSLLVLQKWGI